MVRDPLAEAPSAQDLFPADPAQRRTANAGFRRLALRSASVAAIAALVSASVVLGGLPRGPTVTEALVASTEPMASETAEDPAPTLGAEARQRWREALLEAFPDWSAGRPQAPSERSSPDQAPPAPATPFAQQEPAPQDAPAATPGLPAQTVPLPVPRPPEFRRPAGPEATRRADRQAARRTRTAAIPAPAPDDRNFLEKFFGIERTSTPAMAYAAIETPSPAILPRQRIVPPTNPDPAAVAVYDISARIVTLPNGTKLEAHSGLGEIMDDPRNAHVRMRGATPPGTYDLTEREDLFHGVRAIRLTPVGGSGAVYGRVGLLAHTYMLGPTGASNGCVSFKDYQAFLQAYLRGEVQRLVVVPGRGQDAPPSVAQQAPPSATPPAGPGRSARLGTDA